MTSVVKYFRDHVELPYEEWKEHVDMDMYIEQRSCYWQVEFNIADAADGVELNGHLYFTMYEDHYDTAKELINDMIDYDNSEIIEAILLKNEDEAKELMAYVLRETISLGSFNEEENNNG